MERRVVIFLVASFAFLLLYSRFVAPHQPPAQQGPAAEQAVKPPAGKAQEKPAAVADKTKAEKPAVEAEKTAPAVQRAPEPEVPEQWVTLGSVDEDDPYRMLVMLTNKGAAVARIELSKYFDIDDRSGYLGHLEPGAGGKGCRVQVVGRGTPAAKAGIKPGDVITSVDGKKVTDAESLRDILSKTKPKKKPVDIVVSRDGKDGLELKATLRRRPLEAIRPEGDDPLSMLLTLQRFDDKKLSGDVDKADKEKADKEKTVDPQEQEKRHEEALRRELDGVNLRTANWKILPSDKKDEVRFQRVLSKQGLEITKTYRLVKVPEEFQADADFPAYHLEFEIEIRNIGSAAHKVAYRLDGPNGLPTEGRWYAYKVSRNWGGAGLRDFVVSFGGRTPAMIGAPTIAGGDEKTWPDDAMSFVGVDAQYFSAILLPQRDPADTWFDAVSPIRVGRVDPKHTNLTNTSCRLVGTLKELKPGEVLRNKFNFFAGPKKPSVLKPYALSELVYFGWPIFAMVAVPLTKFLHFLYWVVGNYGLAIILLTVVVRGCMFPLSIKQAHGAQKMAQLQPEIKKLQEKFKNNVEGRTKAQQDLFRKHNYNPLSGCLPIFIQMPVFIGLYRSLMVAIELRDAPLISSSIRWCSNLAAPDMLYAWSWFMPAFVNDGQGIFGLGPYFNLLPILTIVLFIGQQKVMMPPPADEQAAMQQKIMQYMMIFMGLMFFKVASGLCIYFIASSLWGLAERQFLPKAAPIAAGSAVETRGEAKARAREAAEATARQEAAKAKKGRGK